jgi:carbon-monoxide dehydrogenase large subunit
MDPAQVRLANMVAPGKFPYDNGLGWTYDSGDYPAALTRALQLAGYDDIAARKEEARARGKLLGVGIGCFVAVCGVGPSTRMSKEGMLGGTWESANVKVHPTGEVTVTIGSKSTGQSHETTFAQIFADELGIDLDAIEVLHSDTKRAPYGQGTYGSRSYSVGGPAVHLAALQLKEKIRTAAAHFFGVPLSDVVYEDGTVFAVGAPENAKTFQDMAMALWYGWDLPAGMEPALDVTTFFDPADFNFPFGAHIALVEVDTDTGQVEVVRYVAVNDVGTVGNPLVVDGQFEGSIVHGVGQALLEHAVYDPDGQLVTADLTSYPLPRATDAPFFELDRTVTPTPHNTLGAKGAGEIATVPPAAAITNALHDALAGLGVGVLDMPLTPEKVWRAIRTAEAEATR